MILIHLACVIASSNLTIQNSLTRSQIYSGHCLSIERLCVVEKQQVKHAKSDQIRWHIRAHLVAPVFTFCYVIAVPNHFSHLIWVMLTPQPIFLQEIFHPPKR